MNKAKLRQHYTAIRNSLTQAEITKKSRKIIDRLTALDTYQEADIILTYINYNNEVQTIELIKQIFTNQNKQIFCPKVNDNEIVFYEIKNLNELATGYKGIPEPIINNAKAPLDFKNKEAKYLIIIPGVAFDEKCGRIGYGGGYYDRFLHRYESVIASRASAGGFAEPPQEGLQSRPNFTTIALAYECQIAPLVPIGAFDKKPDMIITEDRLIVGEERIIL